MKYISIAPLIAQVTRDIKLMDTGMKSDIKAWISEAIELSQTASQQVVLEYEDDLCDGQIELPNGHGTTLAVFCDNRRIPFKKGIRNLTNHVVNRDFVQLQYQQVKLPDIELAIACFIGTTWIRRAQQAIEEKTITLGYCQNDIFWQNGNNLQSTILKGKFKIYYLGLQIDDDGYPMVLDHSWLKQSIVQFVSWKLQLLGKMQGNPNQTYTMFEKFLARAQNDIELPSYAELIDEE